MRGHRRKPTMMQDIPTIRESGLDDEEPLSDDEDEDDEIEGNDPKEQAEEKANQFMYFNEIAAAVAPMLDEMFPPSSGVKIIAEPGRYLVAASATLVASVVSVRNNLTDTKAKAEGISDKTASENVFRVTRDEEDEIVQETAHAIKREDNSIMDTLVEELTDYSLRYARANLSQQEVDVYLDNIKTNETEVSCQVLFFGLSFSSLI
jgi:arginine decarboxylase-like protein